LFESDTSTDDLTLVRLPGGGSGDDDAGYSADDETDPYEGGVDLEGYEQVSSES
jgi:hypothetical protein